MEIQARLQGPKSFSDREASWAYGLMGLWGGGVGGDGLEVRTMFHVFSVSLK